MRAGRSDEHLRGRFSARNERNRRGQAYRLNPGVSVGVRHIAEAPFALECRKTMSLVFSPTREMLIGEVVRIHAREGLVDPATLRVSLDDYKPVGRMFGGRLCAPEQTAST